MSIVPDAAPPTTPLDSVIAAVLRGELDDPRLGDARQADAIVAAASEHDVVPLVAHRLAASAGVSSALRATLQDASHWAVVSDLAMETELRRMLAVFDSAGVPLLLVKGSHLAYSHYPRPDLRARVDSDVLIARADRDAADALFTQQLGYVADAKVSGDLTATQKLYVLSRNDTTVHLVDLHWRLASPQLFAHVLSFEELHAASVPLPGLGPTARGPAHVHALLIACMHRVAHHHDEAEQFKWLYDIHLIASALSEAEWDAFAALAIERGIAAVSLECLLRSAEWLHTRVPSRLVNDPRVAGAASLEATAAYLRVRPKAREVLDDLRALSTWRDRLSLVGEHLFPPAEHMKRVYAPQSRLPLPLLYAGRLLRGVGGWFRSRKS